MLRRSCFITLFIFSLATLLLAQPAKMKEAPPFDPNVIATTPERAKDLQNQLQQQLRERRDQVNKNDLQEWRKIENLQQWQTFRDVRIEALRKAIGEFPAAPKEVPVHITKTIQGEGYEIDCLLYESRKGLWVSANLYRPQKSNQKGPGIIIIHSHHNPKTEGELQDMGVTWARAGATVLVADLFGHGERRTHPFVDEKSYPRPFRVSRQDYWFRYFTGMQLSLLGESLIGWFAWDTMRGLDVLLKQKNVDPKKIVLLGAVAGGGDPAAVTAALDPRVQYLVPFNFGGPQPETKYPLPEDAEESFNYLGGGSWESTRNIARSAQGGFLPWVIVASIAPRGLIHAHEFAWDEKRDPVWARYQKIWKWAGSDLLASTHGRGSVTGSAPESTHCNNIGLEHRKAIHTAFEKWLDLKVEEAKERRPARELLCWTDDAKKTIQNDPLILWKHATEQIEKYNEQLRQLPEEKRRQQLCADWQKILASDTPKGDSQKVSTEEFKGYKLEKWTTLSDPGHRVPILLLTGREEKKRPVVVGITGLGKDLFFTQNQETIELLLENDIAICLFDPRWTGEVRLGNDRGRQSSLVSISATEQMHGTPVMGQRLEDTLAVVDFLKSHRQIDPQKIILWGESLSLNNNQRETAVPMDATPPPHLGDTCGSTLAVLASLFRPEIKGIISRGGVWEYRSLLKSPFVYHSHDVMIPQVTRFGDLTPLWELAAQKKLLLELPVNGLNQTVSKEEQELIRQKCSKSLKMETSTPKELRDWVQKVLRP